MITAMFNLPKTEPDSIALDRAIAEVRRSPICARCGAQLQGVPTGQVIACPRCKNAMRHVGSLWMEYVSPLELPPQHLPPPEGASRFRFRK